MTKGLDSIRLSDIKITDSLFGTYSKLVADKMLPYQWDILNDQIKDAAPTHCIDNFRIAAGEMAGERRGVVFLDSDLYKWIEAAAYCIANGSGSEYESMVDEAIDLISRAQQKDGYLNTYYTITAPDKRWTNLVEGHELYCIGYLIEAAVAYYNATGKDKLLETAKRSADLVCRVFGRAEGQLRGYPGHQEIELALVRLYRTTGERRYLDCAAYFIEERGSEPNYFIREIEKRGGSEFFHEFDDYDLKYSQSNIPPEQQRTAEGHAVRAMYMYSAMADLALERRDDKLLEACLAIWDNITTRRMYITGSVGSSEVLERFTTDYDLPNSTNYSETCASIGLMMLGQRMTSLTGDAAYYDIVERALYNTVLAGMNLSGDHYFYVNPLEVVPAFCTDHSSMKHVKPERQRWFSIACCPPNLARTLACLGQYIYARDKNALYIHLFIASAVRAEFSDGTLYVKIESSLPQDGRVKIRIDASGDMKTEVYIRIPGYAGQLTVRRNHKEALWREKNNYICLEGLRKGENLFEADFDVKPEWTAANDNVHADEGKVALRKGPFVYCLEEADNGDNLAGVYVRTDAQVLEGEPLKGTPGDLPVLEYDGIRLRNPGVAGNQLYGTPQFVTQKVRLKAIPYCFWNNRGIGEMLVWHKVRI